MFGYVHPGRTLPLSCLASALITALPCALRGCVLWRALRPAGITHGSKQLPSYMWLGKAQLPIVQTTINPRSLAQKKLRVSNLASAALCQLPRNSSTATALSPVSTQLDLVINTMPDPADAGVCASQPGQRMQALQRSHTDLMQARHSADCALRAS